MPFIHIKSLPMAESFDAGAVVRGISEAFAAATGIALEHITVTWDYLRPDHYAVGGRVAASQANDAHPVLVAILAPDFNGATVVRTMLEAVAESIAQQTGVAQTNIFIHYQPARAGMVYDAGQVVDW